MPRIRAESIAAHKELTRQEILATASELFIAQGYAATGLGDIAAIIGIGRTTLYEYFRDKEEILVCLVEETIPELVDEMIAAIPEGLSCEQRLGELLLASLAFVSDDSNLGTLIMREVPKLSPEAQYKVRRAHVRIEEEIVEVCRQAIESGQFRDLDPATAGRIASAMTMCAARALLREDEPKQRMYEMGDTLLIVLLHGLSAPSGA